MRINIVNSKNSKNFYLIKDGYINKKKTTIIVEKLGNLEEVTKKAGGKDPVVWAKEYAKIRTLEENNKMLDEETLSIDFDLNQRIEKNKDNFYNAGYLPIQKIYYSLELNKLCNILKKDLKIEYDLNDILSNLIYSRILNPSSKRSDFEYSKSFLEKPSFSLHDIYRSLKILADNSDEIEEFVYKKSEKLISRNNKVLFYDCTNFFFELEDSKGLRQYGKSKENRPLPIVQMGLFMDGTGLPLSFTITPGNKNEQITLKPLEERIIKDFKLSEFLVCTDAGLNSISNKKYNSINNRTYVSTYSLKKCKEYIKDFALGKDGWYMLNDKSGYSKKYNLDDIAEDFEGILYKERYIIENGIEEKLIVSYSKSRDRYCKHIRNEQIDRAIKKANSSFDKKRQTDPSRFVKRTAVTDNGEIAEKYIYEIDKEKIEEEAKYDGFYAISTNSKISTKEILEINKQRWRIEDTFRLLKSEFKARPVFLSKDDSIKAHFLICFLSLLIFRILENKIGNEYSVREIISTLQSMKFTDIKLGLIPSYNRTDLTDIIHEKIGFRTDYKLIDNKKLKKIFKISKR